MTKHYKYLGNIRNIPPHPEWNEFLSHGQTIAQSIPSLQQAKHISRLAVAEQLTHELGYKDTDISSVVGESADPKDFDRWLVTDTTVVERIGNLIGFALQFDECHGPFAVFISDRFRLNFGMPVKRIQNGRVFCF